MKKMNLKFRIHQLATLATTLLLVLVCVNHFNKPAPDTDSVLASVEPVQTENVRKQPVDARKLAGLHLFGVASNASMEAQARNRDGASDNAREAIVAGQEVDPEKLPETVLKISIDGLFAHEDHSKGHAIISNSAGVSKSYQVGDVIERNVKLHSIHTNYAVVNNNNKLESLKLPEFKTGAISQQPSRQRELLKQLADRQRDS